MNDESNTKTYRALQATGAGRLELVDLPVRAPGAGEVRLRVEACGVCHTDVVTLQASFPGLELPRVPGHEVVGRIDALGAGVSDWKIGQRVGVGFLGGRCGRCNSCRSGDFVNCERQLLTGIHRDGGYAEVMLADQNGLVAIPSELSSVEAAPLLCAGVTTFNALTRSRARAGDLVAIQGIGGLGHLAVQYARRMGFHTVAVARGAEKADLAKALGAHVYIDSDAEDPAAALQALGGAQVVLSTVSNPTAMSQMLAGLGRRGQLMVVGAGPEPMPVSTFGLLFGERSIAGSNTGSPFNIEDSLKFSVLQEVRARIETVPLEDAARAYNRMLKNEARFRMVLTPSA
jgi:D-arabinose 1-dehydrogenase-like Zn-dependent alcohol dehydrogenase